MFSTALSKQHYFIQRMSKLREQQLSMPGVLRALRSSKLPNIEETIQAILANGTYRVVNGNHVDFQNFTLRLTDEILDDVPSYEALVRKHIQGVQCEESPILQACLYRRELNNYISWAIAGSKVIAHYMKYKIGTEDRPNTGQPGIFFRRLPFQVLIAEGATGLLCKIGQKL